MTGYVIVTNVYVGDANLTGDGASYVEFINNGDQIVIIENVEIPPYGSWSPTPPVADHIDNTMYQLQFLTPTTKKKLVMVRKYLNNAVQ